MVWEHPSGWTKITWNQKAENFTGHKKTKLYSKIKLQVTYINIRTAQLTGGANRARLTGKDDFYFDALMKNIRLLKLT